MPSFQQPVVADYERNGAHFYIQSGYLPLPDALKGTATDRWPRATTGVTAARRAKPGPPFLLAVLPYCAVMTTDDATSSPTMASSGDGISPSSSSQVSTHPVFSAFHSRPSFLQTFLAAPAGPQPTMSSEGSWATGRTMSKAAGTDNKGRQKAWCILQKPTPHTTFPFLPLLHFLRCRCAKALNTTHRWARGTK